MHPNPIFNNSPSENNREMNFYLMILHYVSHKSEPTCHFAFMVFSLKMNIFLCLCALFNYTEIENSG